MNAEHVVGQYGYAALFVLVMAESLGVPVPGETALIAAAVYAGTTHHLQIELVIAVAAGAAIIGDNIGYGIGHWGGYRLLRRLAPKLHLDEAKLKVGRYVFLRHGGKVVFFGRFVSILRTYAAFLAGTNRMHWPRFLTFNAAGGIVWAALYGIGYYALGNALRRLRTPVDVGIGAAATLILVAALIYLRRHEKDLEERAEAAMPGPLDRYLEDDSGSHGDDEQAPTLPD